MFYVIDKQTNDEADRAELILTEEWANHLLAMDPGEWAIDEDGQLLLIDDCNNIAYAPPGRFRILWELYPTES